MELGTFSISLAVKDLEASRHFYEKLGFKVFAGDASQNWLILKNGDHAIGLSKGCSRGTSSPSTPTGTECPAAGYFYGCPRAAAPAQGSRGGGATSGGRADN